MKRVDIAGQRFGALLALSFSRVEKESTVWIFACDCGAFIERVAKQVRNAARKGQAISCGCVALQVRAENGRNNKTHGFSGTKLYDVHFQMLRRCYNPECKDYPAYGERGISVCDAWHDLATFIEWCRSSGYREGLTIEREDVNGDYTPENCTWIINENQARNRRHHVIITANGQTRPVFEWTGLSGLSRTTIITRLRLGWSQQDSVTVPVGARRPA